MKNIERQKEYLKNQKLFQDTKHEFEKAKETHLLYKKRYHNKFLKVLKIMGEIEHKSLQKHGLKYYRSSYPHGRYTTQILTIKPLQDGVFLKYRTTEDWGDGDYNQTYYKTFIPYKYFDLSDAELKKEHTNWSHMKIIELEKNRERKIELFKKKMKEEEEIATKNLYLKLKMKFEPNEINN